MTFEELVTQLQGRGHRKELEDVRVDVAREIAGLKGSRQQVARAHAETQIARLVAQYMDGTAQPESTARHEVAKRVAATLLADVKRDTNKRLLAVALPSKDRLVDRPERGSGQIDLGSALARLEAFLQREGGIVRLVGDRDSFTAVYREQGATNSSLNGAIVDLVGKMEREKKI